METGLEVYVVQSCFFIFIFEKVHLSSGGNQIVLNYFTDHFTFFAYIL